MKCEQYTVDRFFGDSCGGGILLDSGHFLRESTSFEWGFLLLKHSENLSTTLVCKAGKVGFHGSTLLLEVGY